MQSMISIRDYEGAIKSTEGFNPNLEPPSPQFRDELASPQLLRIRGDDYPVHVFNAHLPIAGESTTLPLFMSLQYGSNSTTRGGVFLLHRLAQTLDRPIIYMDLPGDGRAPKPRSATQAVFNGAVDTRLEALERLGIESVDFAGVCLGGIMAASMAQRFGDRANHLVTFSVPGFERGAAFKVVAGRGRETARVDEYRRQSKERDGYAGLATSDQPTAETVLTGKQSVAARYQTNRSNALEYYLSLAIGVGIIRPRVALAVAGLSTTTQWHDVVGGVDSFTDWSRHTRAATERNISAPNSSHVTVITDAGHDFSVCRSVLTAAHIQRALTEAASITP